jgi:hypothetical protein
MEWNNQPPLRAKFWHAVAVIGDAMFSRAAALSFHFKRRP